LAFVPAMRLIAASGKSHARSKARTFHTRSLFVITSVSAVDKYDYCFCRIAP
jgi:hypothetical protein